MTSQQPLSQRMNITPDSKRVIKGDDWLDMQRQAQQLEAEAAILRARFTISEPSTYSRHSPHSFFADIAKIGTGRGDRDAARRRLERHEAELAVTYPAWRQARARAAHTAYEAAFGGDRRSQIMLERMDQLGLSRFRTEDAFERTVMEQRAINRTDGTGGYFHVAALAGRGPGERSQGGAPVRRPVDLDAAAAWLQPDQRAALARWPRDRPGG
jgi:hypothetical protein